MQEFRDVFPDEIPGIPPKSDINFTFELVPGEATMSQTSYRMNKPECNIINCLADLKWCQDDMLYVNVQVFGSMCKLGMSTPHL